MKIKNIHHDKNIIIKNEKINNQSQSILGKNEDDSVKSDGKKEIILEIKHLKEMIERTILSYHNYKIMDILTSNDINISIQYLEKIYQNLEVIEVENDSRSKPISEINEEIVLIKSELSSIFRNYGTHNIDDLLEVTFGKNYMKNIHSPTNPTTNPILNTTNGTVNATQKESEWDHEKFEVLKMFFHPIHFKSLNWKNEKKSATNDKLIQKNKIVEDFVIVEKSLNLDCFDMARTSKIFYSRVFGIKVAIHNHVQQKTLIIGGVVDNVFLECSSFKFIKTKLAELWKNVPKDPEYMTESFTKYIKSLTLKDLLVFSNDEIYSRYLSTITFITTSKQKQTSQLIKEFMNTDLYSQRSTILQLLLKSHEHDLRYLSYLLYDMLSNELSPQVESNDQVVLFNSLPWNVKQYFKDTMKQTVSYTNTMSKYESGNMTLEQQICLLKATDTVKEKAMVKLREIKSKSDDTTTKARQYLEGLLKIPFGIYIKENIMEECGNIRDIYTNMFIKNEIEEFIKVNNVSGISGISGISGNGNNSSSILEIKNSCIQINENIETIGSTYTDKFIADILNDKQCKKSDFIAILQKIKIFIKKHKLVLPLSANSTNSAELQSKNDKTKTISSIKTSIDNYMKELYNMCHIHASSSASSASSSSDTATKINMVEDVDDLFKEIIAEFKIECYASPIMNINNTNNQAVEILKNIENMGKYIENVRSTLDSAVHGHASAKRQIERIIGQWITGESSGYCFGFEGPPGVGKTSLAKYGLAKCLTNDNGESRPFAFIAMGGSSNGSTLEGHNYTYVGSTWGKIVDVLMDKKCMNPIIFIDELDKISNTEHGREIVGILTHLIDSTQNDCFQDKYFSGVDLDLSKALFIFSYNNPEAVDKILLDRIHRIKFKHMSIDEKLTICNDYLLPEMYKKMGLNKNVIHFSEENLKYIIERYTCEPGVRKLKELLFEIVGEMNIQHIKNKTCIKELPIKFTNEEIKMKYLKERHEVRIQKIPPVSNIGVINGLWANAVGQGGIIPIEAHMFPCDRFFDLKLTGMQGDVMKESMNVAKTLAWSLLTDTEIESNLEKFSKTKMQGIHIHCPEGATPKDGPSAGTAITCVIYSILTRKKINNAIAITGEINLQGNVTAIGGLDLKIMGGINGGVTTFIFPKDNIKDFNDFMDKNGTKDEVKSIVFIPVASIQEVLAIIFC
jgi:ATP-dependent Lon protease